MAAICTVTGSIHVPNTEPCVSTSVSMGYIGQGLRREEVRATISSSDWADDVHR